MSAKDYEGSAHRSEMIVSKAVIPQASPRSLPAKLIICPSWANQPSGFMARLASILTANRIDVSQEGFPIGNVAQEDLYIVLDSAEYPILTNNSSTLFDSVMKLLVKATRVLWLSIQQFSTNAENPERALINGVARVARAENEALKLVTIDVQDGLQELNDVIFEKIKDVARNGFYELSSDEFEYVYKGGELFIPRLQPNEDVDRRIQQAAGKLKLELQPFHQTNRPLKLDIKTPGFLDSLQFIDDEAVQCTLSDSEIEIKVEACGVNFKHVFIASGQMPNSESISGEYAGRVTKVGAQLEGSFRVGDRVCGIGKAYASIIRSDGRAVCRLPDSMSLTLGASIPIVFATAYYALVDVARLQKDQTILIHSAAGGVGQAALRIAQHIGAEVFATVGSPAKRDLLIEEFRIPEDHIFSSKLRTFKRGIFRLTRGRGVDVVLNSMSGQTLQDSWACIASLGTFLELGKTDPKSNSFLSMNPFNRSVAFASIDLQAIYDLRPNRTGQILAEVLSLFEAKQYLPIKPIMQMPITEIEEAFRLMQARKHMGKIVLEAKSDTMVFAPPKVGDAFKLPSKATFLIAGGLGGIGLEIARFMVTRGAKHIALLSRRSLDSVKEQQLEEEFRSLGAKVRVFACDITDVDKLRETISNCALDMPPIKGVVQTTMVLRARHLAFYKPIV